MADRFDGYATTCPCPALASAEAQETEPTDEVNERECECECENTILQVLGWPHGRTLDLFQLAEATNLSWPVLEHGLRELVAVRAIERLSATSDHPRFRMRP